MTTTTVDTTMREDHTEYRGIFSFECFTYATIYQTENGRWVVRMGDKTRPFYGFTHRTDAMRFLKAQNGIGKTEIARRIAANTATAASKVPEVIQNAGPQTTPTPA